MRFAKNTQHDTSKVLRLPRKMTMDTSKVLRLPRKLQHIFWKRRKSIAPATQNDFRHVAEHVWMSRSATPATRNEATRRLKPPKRTTSAKLPIGTAIRSSHERLRTVADGCGRLRTVANGCGRLRPQTQRRANTPSTPRPPEWNGNPCYAFGKKEHFSVANRVTNRATYGIHPQMWKRKLREFSHKKVKDFFGGLWWHTIGLPWIMMINSDLWAHLPVENMLKPVAQWFPYCKLSSLDEFGAPHFKKSLESTVAEMQVFVGGCAAMVDGPYHHSYLLLCLWFLLLCRFQLLNSCFCSQIHVHTIQRVNITQRDLTFGVIKRG